MEFTLKKNSTLPILKLQVQKDGRSDYNSFMKTIELYIDEDLFNRPTTREQCYYRYLFNKYYKYSDNVIPYFWMPKYTNAKDASARSLDIYKYNNTNGTSIE